MAKARKAKKAKTARKSPKKRRTAAQKAATKKMLAANKKARKAKPAKARKAAKPRTRKARKSPAKRKAAPRKRAASRRRASGGGSTTTIVNKVEAGKSAARRASKPRRKPARKAASKRKSAPRRKAARKSQPKKITRVVRTTTNIAYRNPMGKGNGTVKMLAIGMVSTAVGFGGAELIDRLIVTRAGQDKAGTAGRITGYGAILVRSNVPDVYRYAASGGGTLVLGAATWAAAKYTRSDAAVAVLGGLTFGFGLKMLALGVQHVLPYILPVTSISEDTWQNQLFPENFFKESQPTSAQLQGATFGGSRRFGAGAVGRSDFGPTAGGQTGCGCDRCKGAQNSPKAQAPQAPSARQAEPAAAAQPGSVVEIQEPSGSVGQPPASELNNVTPIKRGASMSDVLGLKE